jgi:hypothetical protein
MRRPSVWAYDHQAGKKQRVRPALILAPALVAGVRRDRTAITDSYNEILGATKSPDWNKLFRRGVILELVVFFAARLSNTIYNIHSEVLSSSTTYISPTG